MTVLHFTPKPSFEEVYETHYDRIYKYVYTILMNREDAEDVTAETFLSAYKHYKQYDEKKASVATWLTRIAHNSAVNLLRSAERTKRTEMPEYWEEASKEDLAEQAVESELMLTLYRQLNPEERSFLNMRYVMDLKDREIAELLGMNEKTVNKRYQRLLVRCRDLLGGKENVF